MEMANNFAICYLLPLIASMQIANNTCNFVRGQDYSAFGRR
jgi:hypothetical protein